MKVGTDGILLGAWVDLRVVRRILDIGTGCGLIALMTAQRTEATQPDLVGVEIEAAAAAEALENANASPWANRIEIINAPIQSLSAHDGVSPFDLIVSNPPFFEEQLRSPADERSLARHDLRLNADEFWTATIGLLSKSGRVSMILPVGEFERHLALAGSLNMRPIRLTHVRPLPGRSVKRLLVEFGFEGELVETELIVEEIRHQYTDAFKQLTAGFYLGHPELELSRGGNRVQDLRFEI